MKNFGETLRDLRVAQDLGLRETATKVGISPAYLSLHRTWQGASAKAKGNQGAGQSTGG